MFADVSPGIDQHDNPHAAAGAPGRYQDAASTPSERTYATFTHLSLLAVHVLVPVLPALVMWLIKRHDSPFLDDHGKEAVNFQISLLLYAIILVPVAGIITCGLGFLLIIPVALLAIIGGVLAATAAHRGEFYRYPATIRLVH